MGRTRPRWVGDAVSGGAHSLWVVAASGPSSGTRAEMTNARRITAFAGWETEGQARTYRRMNGERFDYDVRQLSVGDVVEVFVERRWERGTFQISTAGTAFVDIPARTPYRFE